MTLHRSSWRDRPTGGTARPENRRRSTSPSVQACVPAGMFDRIADEAVARQVPVSAIVREALALRFPEKGEEP